MKQKQCKAEGCEVLFTPRNMLHNCHHWKCAIKYQKELVATREAKAKRKAIKEFKANDKSELTKKAQQVFNKYIRLRDGNKCITCGNENRQIHAGHYRPVGRNAKLRFNEFNCHSQCSICNNHLSGNLVPYRDAMIGLYGLAVVEELESDNEPYKYDVDELNEIIDTYKQKTKDMI